ncbi:hypothetical protein [Naasia lichenicola]|uniref:ABC transporter ATP-binding protein n=1 Tax=Naasia lichenicola TaxID=2565933 RepID=A0A4S4FGY5_9MICO|nr:hypothetical protein [Naasia lichenicola]THG29539.1 hypothetical protein E6C64_12675 [Naasia lichenicola]
MRIQLKNAAIGAGASAALPPLSMTLESGAVGVIRTTGTARPTRLGLLLGGRMKPTSGEVLLDGRRDPRGLRKLVAVVDAPGIAEPPAGVALHRAVATELALGGHRSRRPDAMRVLDRHGLKARAADLVESLAPEQRIALLIDLAASRPGIAALVLVAPHRHGGDPALWLPALEVQVDRGLLVGVITDAPTADELVSLGARDAALTDTADPGSDVFGDRAGDTLDIQLGRTR